MGIVKKMVKSPMGFQITKTVFTAIKPAKGNTGV